MRLKYADKPNAAFSYQTAITQIECRQKFGNKLKKTLEAVPGFIFTRTLAGEQASSDSLAEFHLSLCGQARTAVDLTAGLGIDALTLARNGICVTAIDRDPELAQNLRHNAKAAGVEQLFNVICADCRDFVDTTTEHFDVAFIDPARRADDGSRIFALEQCQPDVISMLPMMRKMADRIIIKASPMLDIVAVVRSLPIYPNKVIAAGTPTECKELIIVIDKETPANFEDIEIIAATITPDGTVCFNTTAGEENQAPWPRFDIPRPGDYICEPYPADMKVGAFRLLSHKYDLIMMNPNTRVLFAHTLPENFPGTCYKITSVEPFSSSVIKKIRRSKPAMEIASRNFGMSAPALRAKLGATEGSSTRLYAVTATNNTRLLIFTTR